MRSCLATPIRTIPATSRCFCTPWRREGEWRSPGSSTAWRPMTRCCVAICILAGIGQEIGSRSTFAAVAYDAWRSSTSRPRSPPPWSLQPMIRARDGVVVAASLRCYSAGTFRRAIPGQNATSHLSPRSFAISRRSASATTRPANTFTARYSASSAGESGQRGRFLGLFSGVPSYLRSIIEQGSRLYRPLLCPVRGLGVGLRLRLHRDRLRVPAAAAESALGDHPVADARLRGRSGAGDELHDRVGGVAPLPRASTDPLCGAHPQSTP